MQRGTPTLSGLHVSRFSQLPAQQSHEALHDVVASLQTSPFGLQPTGLRQTPTVFGAVIEHVTGIPLPPGRPADPQQSPSVRQRSPTTWHPLAGWQTNTPVGPYGAQRRLQHAPPQVGIAESCAEEPPQMVPSVIEQFAEPEGGWLQVP